MKTRENTTTFESMNEKATEFYNRHGWVVINQRLDKLTVDEARSSWVELRALRQEMGVSMDAYRKEISQWRDLWTHGGAFLNLLDNHEQVRGVAQDGMDWSGVRLLHDHIIAKPAGKTNKKIPLASRFHVLAGRPSWLFNMDADGRCWSYRRLS